MKNISYTKMRDELADVLDALRNGEPVTVTQRGKPDLVLNAENLGAATNITPSWKRKNSEIKQAEGIRGKGIAGLVEAAKSRISTTSNLDTQGVSPSKSAHSGKSLSFSEARKKTLIKHAGIIKALEDK